MFQITLTDSTTSYTFTTLSRPLTYRAIEGAVDVETLDNNIYTDFTELKGFWSHTWRYMSEAEYQILRGFYERQFTLLAYPKLTITAMSVANVSVRMTLSPQSIIDNCGKVENATATFRESTDGGS